MRILHPGSVLAALALAAVGPLAHAQQSPSRGKVFARYGKALRSAHVDAATGTVTLGPRVKDRSGTTSTDFSNNDLGGFVGVDTGNCFCEWFDAGVKGFSGNASDMMNDVVFAYCSAMASVGSGGPGGSVKLGFYEGYTLGGGSPTTAVAVFTLTGLPGNSASSSFLGGFTCYFIQVTFGSLICFADGPIGYSWKFLDVGTTGILAGTWPFLSCVVSCSGTVGQVDGQGMTDFVDEYCPPGFLRSTFTFGTTSGSFTSMSMQIDEATDDLALASSFNGDLLNKDVLSSSTAIVGGTFTSSFTIPGAGAGHGHGAGGSFTLKIRTTALDGPGGGPNITSPLGGRMTEILTSGPLLATITGSHNGVSGSITPQPIPKSLALLCQSWAAQTTILGGGFGDLSTARKGNTGTF